MCYGEGGTCGIALGTLNSDELGIFVDCGSDALIVEGAVVEQIHLTVGHAVLGQRAGAGTDANDLLERVVGSAYRAEKLVAGQQIGAQRYSQGMSTAGDLRTHKGSLRVEHVSINVFQVVTAHIIVAVAGGCGKAGGGNPVFLHGRQDLCLVILCNAVNGIEAFFQFGNGAFAVLINSRADTHGVV